MTAEEEQIAMVDVDFFRDLFEGGCIESFVKHMRKRAELIARMIPGCENDRLAAVLSGRLAVCYELADDALAAQSAAEMNAKVEEAERIRREIAGA